MRKFAKTLLMLLGVIGVVFVVDTAFTAWACRSRNPRGLHLVKRLHKYQRPVSLRFAGRSGPAAIVHHVGRRSGTPYATPVLAHQSDGDVIIPLPYGTAVDWFRNLETTGRAVVDLEGRSLTVDGPAVVDIDDVIGLLPPSMVRLVRLNGAREAARLRVSASRAATSA